MEKQTMNQLPPIVRIESASKEYGGVAGGPSISVLNDINLVVYPGETVGIIGPSGSGKKHDAESSRRFRSSLQRFDRY